MNLSKEDYVKLITRLVIEELSKKDKLMVPIGISNRHIHLSKEDLEVLFGKGYTLTKYKDLKQPGQFAAKETVRLVGKKGEFSKVRILGPVRKETQVEISKSDGFVIGVDAPIKESGMLEATPGIKLIGPAGIVEKSNGVIAALRHIHMPTEVAKKYSLNDRDFVTVKTEGERETEFSKVLVRVSDNYELEIHLDMDEANASGAKNGDCVTIIKK